MVPFIVDLGKPDYLGKSEAVSLRLACLCRWITVVLGFIQRMDSYKVLLSMSNVIKLCEVLCTGITSFVSLRLYRSTLIFGKE